MKHKITREDHEPIRAAILGGERSDVVASRYGISRQRAEFIAKHGAYDRHKSGPIEGLEGVKKAMVELRQNGRTVIPNDAERAAIALRYAEGLAKIKTYVTATAIAEYLGLPVCDVRPIVRRKFIVPMAKAMQEDAK